MSQIAESPGIGLYSETGLHSSLKMRYAARSPEARLEVKMAGRVVDVVLPDELVEVQTRSLGSIVNKLLDLACLGRVRVVHPVKKNTIIERYNIDGSIASKRTSNKHENFWSVFDELVHAPLIVASPNIAFDFVFVDVSERRIQDGMGNRRRKGERIIGRELVRIHETRTLDSKDDWLKIIPEGLPAPFSVKSLALALKIPGRVAGKILYTFSRAGLVEHVGMDGRAKIYCLSHSSSLESASGILARP